MEVKGWSFSAVKDKAFFTYALILGVIRGPQKVIREK